MRKFSELRDRMPEEARAESHAAGPKMLDVCEHLGIGPASFLARDIEDGDGIVVRRADRFSSEDIHQAVFDTLKPEAKSDQELRDGIHRYIRNRYARG